MDLEKWIDVLEHAESSRVPVDPITEMERQFGVDEAYAVQAGLVARRLGRGERVVGAKLGLTSRAKQQAMGVDTPIFGVLTSAMELQPEEPVPLDDLIHPRAEPEIAFLIGDDIVGAGVTARDVLDATSGICAAIEIIDSRYSDFRFTHSDVIADNTSAARFVLGTTVIEPRAVDLAVLGVVLESSGTVVETATGAAALGHPAVAVALLANHLSRRGEDIPAGSVVLSGGLTNAVSLDSGGDVTSSYAHLGRIHLRVQ